MGDESVAFKSLILDTVRKFWSRFEHTYLLAFLINPIHFLNPFFFTAASSSDDLAAVLGWLTGLMGLTSAS
jgi:hypothetical protein